MKAVVFGLILLGVWTAAYGQGQVVINNRIVPDVTARLVNCSDPGDGSVSSVGTDYVVSFFGGPAGKPISQLQPLDPPSSTMRGPAGTALAGYFVGVTATVPGVLTGETADIAIRVTGPSLPGGSWTIGPFTVVLGGGTVVPPNLPMGTSPIPIYCIPEPSIILLGLAGGGAWLFHFRRSSSLS